jgi:hypothetical protein
MTLSQQQIPCFRLQAFKTWTEMAGEISQVPLQDTLIEAHHMAIMSFQEDRGLGEIKLSQFREVCCRCLSSFVLRETCYTFLRGHIDTLMHVDLLFVLVKGLSFPFFLFAKVGLHPCFVFICFLTEVLLQVLVLSLIQ